jgi:hypothetical protein
MSQAEVTRAGVLDMQVCVPQDWTDEQVKDFADTSNPCGTTAGWQIRTDPKLLAGCKVRQPCESDLRDGFVHVTLDA